MAKLTRPSSCFTCELHPKAEGFALPEGPESSWLLLLGEALGKTEAMTGRPFVGDAGGMLQRLLNMLGWDRSQIRIANTISCRPPNDWLDGASWQRGAISHCAVHRDPVLAAGHKVVVPLGSIALKNLLGLEHQKRIKVQDFHGTVQRDPSDRFWVVPTFHPSFLQRGAHNMIGTVLWDLKQAERVWKEGKPADTSSLVIDPPIEWFTAWVDQVRAAIAQDPWAYPISVDVETPDKAHGRDEGEITTEDRSYQILRVNVACHPDEGITVPFQGPYVQELTRLLAGPAVCWLWNGEYDLPRLLAAETLDSSIHPRAVDLMWLWHYLQSDLPRGLGFAAPFYSDFGPWKHLADSDPARYGAIDGLQTHRIGFGVLGDLQGTHMYAGALRHVHALHHLALKPAQRIGVKIDREKLLIFKADLTEKAITRLDKLQGLFPDELRQMTPKQGLTSRPADNILHVKATAFTRRGKAKAGKPVSEIKLDLYKKAVVVERLVLKEILVCKICGETEVHRKHRCRKPYEKKDGTTGWKPADYPPDISLEVASVTRWFWQEPFNPDSPAQVMAYLKFKGHPVGKAKKTHKDTTNRETLEKLEKKTGDPFYRTLLDYRAIQKVKGTYVDGTERRLDADDRVHPVPTFKPSTMRLSYIDPNITNVVSDKGGDSLASGFRRCVVATPGCRLLEADFSAIESVETGWFSRDPGYLRLSKLGVHAGLASHVLGRPYDTTWSDVDLGAYFKEIKSSKDQKTKETYERSKRFIHGFSYGLTIHGMTLQFPDIFPTVKIAEKYADIFRSMAPEVPKWQRSVREFAFKNHYLGGTGLHPFGYKHWFWSVYNYKKILPAQYYKIMQKFTGREEEAPVAVINGQYFKVGLGEDGKRCIAFYPQSTAAGVLKESMLRLFDPDSPSYIGDAYYGETPLRAPIHDSLLLEIPDRQWDRVCEHVFREMQRPILQQPLTGNLAQFGDFLSIGVAAKQGLDWADMRGVPVPGFTELGVGSEPIYEPMEDEDQDDLNDFGREVA